MKFEINFHHGFFFDIYHKDFKIENIDFHLYNDSKLGFLVTSFQKSSVDIYNKPKYNSIQLYRKSYYDLFISNFVHIYPISINFINDYLHRGKLFNIFLLYGVLAESKIKVLSILDCKILYDILIGCFYINKDEKDANQNFANFLSRWINENVYFAHSYSDKCSLVYIKERVFRILCDKYRKYRSVPKDVILSDFGLEIMEAKNILVKELEESSDLDQSDMENPADYDNDLISCKSEEEFVSDSDIKYQKSENNIIAEE